MSDKILVTGGTGTLGRLVVPQLTASGLDVRLLSRQAREPENGVEYVSGDLVKGEGIERAVSSRSTPVTWPTGWWS